MIQFRRIVICSIVACLELQYMYCSEGKDNKGKHFIFGFMNNRYGVKQEVFITTDCRCTVNVNISTPLYNPGFLKMVKINRHDVYTVAFSPSIQSSPGTILSNKGIEITSNEEIAVFAVNKAGGTSDAFVVFPLDTLGDNYFVLTWNDSAEFIIIATEENTTVNIFIADGTNIRFKSVTYRAGEMLNIIMNKYQTFNVYGGSDYTGTRITSDKPITVISGASCTKIGLGACDHLASQMTPVETFGNKFVTINMPNCKRPVNFKIVASENNTEVNITGRDQVMLSKPGDKYLFRIVDQTSKYVVSSKPIAIAFFSEGGCGMPTGDPSMILLQPIQQFAADYTFTTIVSPTKPFHDALTIVIPESEIGGLILDGKNISAKWRQIDGSDDLQITDVNVTKGAHTVYHINPTVIFLAVSTGLADYNSYGYSSGQRLAPINSICTQTLTVPGDIIDNDCDGLIDEELKDGIDNDGDGKIDEDLATYVEEFESTTTTTLSTKELPTTEFLTMELPTTEFSRTELPTTEFSTAKLSTTELSTKSMSATSTSTFLKTFAPTTTSSQTMASRKLTTTPIQSTTTIPSTSNMQMSNFSEEVLNTDLVIAGVVISMFALCCFITGMFFFKWKRNIASKAEGYDVSR